MTEHGSRSIWIGKVSYTAAVRRWLQNTDHYLGSAPPGCLFAVGVMQCGMGLFEDVPVGDGVLRGLCVVGRPVARGLPQDHTVGEVVRMWLQPGLPYGTASRVLRRAADIGRARKMVALIAYHDRTRHSGCIYKKAGFRRDGVTNPSLNGWASRPGRKSGELPATPKRRWRLDL